MATAMAGSASAVAMAKPRPCVAPASQSARLTLQQFALLRSHGGVVSFNESGVRGGASQRRVLAGASVGEAEADVETESGEAKFERVLETLGRSRALDALEERVAEGDGGFGSSNAAGEFPFLCSSPLSGF